MNKLWLIAKSNLKKRKGNIVTLFVLTAIAVVLMYSSLNVLLNVNGFIGQINEKQNGAHVIVLATHNYQEEMMDLIKGIDHFEAVEAEEKLMTVTVCDITNVSQKNSDKDTMIINFRNMDQKYQISDWDVVDKADTKMENSIVMPMYLKTAKGYRTGDKVQIKINHTTMEYVIYGFIEDVMFASPTNIAVYSCQVTDTMFEKLRDVTLTKEMYQYNIRLDSSENSEEYEGILSKEVTAQMTQPDFGTNYIMNFSTISGAASTMINIIMAILAMFSIVMVIIVVLVIRFNMMMYLEENLPNIGIMEAQGYTTKQIRGAMLLEYLVVCVVGITAGFIVASVSSALVSNTVSGSIGMAWTAGVDVTVGIGVVVFIVLFVIGIVMSTASRIKKITTLDALRGGIKTHNFKKNPMPLSKGRYGVNTSLGFKSLLYNGKQNIAVALIVSLLSFACVLSLLIYYNFAVDDTSLLTLVGMEKCDIEVVAANKTEKELEDLKAELTERGDIKQGILFGWQGITICNDTDELSVTTDVYNDFEGLVINTIYEGREPERENEIVVTSVIANRFGVGIGDSIQVKVGDVSESYLICGISQQISNLGVRARMTKQGAKRLNSQFTYNGIDLYVADDVENVATVIEAIKTDYRSDMDLKMSNIDESFTTIIGTFSDSLVLMCFVFVVITVVVVTMIIILIMRMKMVRERRTIGVYKAIGYTTRQILWQMVIGFAPVITAGGVLGTILGAVSINQVFMLALSMCQIRNAALSISGVIIGSCIVAITILAFAVSIMVSLKARRIEPYKMIVEE